jgi:putative transposase
LEEKVDIAKLKAFLPYTFVEALCRVMKQTDNLSMPSQSNHQTMKKVLMIEKVTSNPPRNRKTSQLAFQDDNVKINQYYKN